MAEDLVQLLGPTLLKKVGGVIQEVPTAAELEGKVVGIYFSAHWCPPCRGFTPILSDIYNDLGTGEDKFQIVFVSSDRNEQAFDVSTIIFLQPFTSF